ncbi:hypothetical protein K458DRAFT_393043 [Lentithecium fluviatile CBS 122367]|uniref:Extracellular membrane protein CFEM domain-containing protein n=1 Tax=Lentithecium fluviatile CBS 122367 TaxID=1168545 RepID=A0A6G1IQL9_9PLEO|nr:hypothetical protein K458DRAFT_393043 [Lentithecium fluviatile CBS 122367]
MRSPPIPPCTILLLLSLFHHPLPLATAQEEPLECPEGYNATCCPCVTSSNTTLCGDPALIDTLSECYTYHPEGWACCVGTYEGAFDWSCFAAWAINETQSVGGGSGMAISLGNGVEGLMKAGRREE